MVSEYMVRREKDGSFFLEKTIIKESNKSIDASADENWGNNDEKLHTTIIH